MRPYTLYWIRDISLAILAFIGILLIGPLLLKLYFVYLHWVGF